MEDNERFAMKRKDIDRVNEEFSDFSLSSPARKIRRLDVDLPPIMEEEEIDLPMRETVADEIELAPVNDERAIVPFKSLHHHHQPTSGNIFVDRHLISGFRNRFLRDTTNADVNHFEDQRSNKCQAVVCWNPSQSPYSQYIENSQKPSTVEITELDETGEDVVMDDAANETDDKSKSSGVLFPPQGQLQEEPTYGFGLHQWQPQQNCIIPQLPQVSNTPTPITWFQ